MHPNAVGSRWWLFPVGLVVAACGTDGTPSPSGPEDPGVASSITILSGNDQTGELSVTLDEAFTIRVTDARGDGVGNARVTWRVVSGAGVLSYYGGSLQYVRETSMLTRADGIAYTRFAPWAPGQNVVTAEVDGLGGRVAMFRVDVLDLEWPPAPASAAIYGRSEYSPQRFETDGAYSERFVVGEDGRFRLQARSGRTGLREMVGDWSGNARRLTFVFDDAPSVGDWTATGAYVDGGCLDVAYAWEMWLEGYEDGRYCPPAGSP